MQRLRHPVSVVAVAVMCSAAASAQRGGSGPGPGVHGSGVHGSGITQGFGAAIPLHTATAPSAGARSVITQGGYPYNIRQDYPPPPGLTPPAAGYTGILPGAFRYNNYNNNYRHLQSTYFNTPYYYPSLDYGGSPYVSQQYEPPIDSGPDPLAMAQTALGDQVQRLTDQVNQLASNQATPQQASAPPPPPPPVPPITVVLRNGQQVQIQNYAVMNNTLWDLSSKPTRKIPVASIDVLASRRATEAAGGEFPNLDSNVK